MIFLLLECENGSRFLFLVEWSGAESGMEDGGREVFVGTLFGRRKDKRKWSLQNKI